MNILVTGSSGFIAGRFVERLLEEDHCVWGIDVKPPKVNNPWLIQLTWDIARKEQFPLFALPKFDLCYHFAAVADLNYAREHCAETINVNVNGTANMLEYCRKLGVKVFNYISTCCCYGNTPEHPTTEDAPKCPTDIYGNTKLAGEYLVRSYGLNGLDYNILRLATTYGPSMRKELAIYIFLKKAMEGKKIPIHGDGGQTRSFAYIDDVTEALHCTLEEGVKNETINLAGAEEVSVTQLAMESLSAVRPVARFLSNPQIVHVEDRPGQIRKEQIDISKARELLGWSPCFDIKRGLKKTLDWIQKDIAVKKGIKRGPGRPIGGAYPESIRRLWRDYKRAQRKAKKLKVKL